ncbi:unnamed protein product [Caenorhabditis nigoni]
MKISNVLTLFFAIFFKISNVSSIFTDADKIYNETEARVLFELVAAVHNSQPQFCLKASFPNPQTRPKLITQFFVRCDHLNSDCTFALFELPGEQVVVAIRGTRTMSQFFFETMSAFIPDTSFHGLGEINYYFSMTHKSIWPKIRDVLIHSNYSNHDVIFTGHSLGGSLAALSAFESILTNVRNESQVKVVTLAEPRTGNRKFAKNFDKSVKYSFRIINGIDVLAHLPPCHKDYRFWPRVDLPCDPRSRDGPYHHSTEVWYPDGMNETAKYIIIGSILGRWSPNMEMPIATVIEHLTKMKDSWENSKLCLN